MAFPSVVGTQFSLETGDVTTHNINIPSGAAGDRCIVGFAYDGPTETPGWPAGWNPLVQVERLSAVGMEVRYRDYDGSEGATVDVTTTAEESAHEAVLVDAGTFDVGTAPAAAGASGASTGPAPPTLNPANWDAEDTLWILMAASDVSTAFTGYPTDYADNRHTHTSGGTQGVGIAVATRNLNAASQTPDSFLIAASEDWVTVTIAIRPTVAGAEAPRLQVMRRRLIVRR
jgi:hypothetical protein